MDEEFVHVAIYSEVHLAINFVTSFLNKMLPQGRIKLFGDALARALMNKYEGHWFPECPLKGSAFRCFEFGQYIEPEIKHAVRQAGLRCRDVLVCVPPELSIWVDPGTVSYRIGIEGPVKPVLSESGCVTCFYDPDFHDEDPDPPGIARNGKYYDEMDVLDLPIIQTLKEKHGKMKREDIMFLAENGTEDYGPNTEGVRMMQSTTATPPQENLKIKLLMVMEAEGEPVTKGDRVMTAITIGKSAITVTKTEAETAVEVLPQAADVVAAATIMVATADKALVAAVMMMALAAAVEAVSVSMSVVELVAAEMAAVAEMIAMAKMVAMIEMATEEMVVVEEMAVAMLVAAVLGAAIAMLAVAVLVAAVLVVVSAALVVGVVVVVVAAIAAATVAMAPPPPPTTTAAAPPTVVPAKRM